MIVTNEIFPPEDLRIFQEICKRIAWLPERLDLAPQNGFERVLMYAPANYNKMLLGGLAFELDLGMCTVIVGNPALLTDALALPGGSRVILGIPGAISSGPMLLREVHGVQFSAYKGVWDEEPAWLHRGIDLFREEFQSKMKMYENLPGPEGTRDDEDEPTIQP